MDKLIKTLKNGGIAVIPTDTIYGIVGSALNPKTVERIYKLRKRALGKPMIILILSLEDLKKFDIKLTQKQKEFLQKNWPNPLSVILPVKEEKFKYLHRGKNSLAFRMPKNKNLLKILSEVGPLVAPSANFAGGKPAENISEAKEYFGDSVAIYLDGGQISSEPSTLVTWEDDSIKILRQGSFKQLL